MLSAATNSLRRNNTAYEIGKRLIKLRALISADVATIDLPELVAITKKHNKPHTEAACDANLAFITAAFNLDNMAKPIVRATMTMAKEALERFNEDCRSIGLTCTPYWIEGNIYYPAIRHRVYEGAVSYISASPGYTNTQRFLGLRIMEHQPLGWSDFQTRKICILSDNTHSDSRILGEIVPASSLDADFISPIGLINGTVKYLHGKASQPVAVRNDRKQPGVAFSCTF